MRVAGTRILIASAFCVMPRGRRNSSRSISPGCVVTLCNFHPVAGLLIVILVLRPVEMPLKPAAACIVIFYK
jgi:hypothetical protein